MSLDYRLDQIADYKNLCWVDAGKDDSGEPLYRIAPVTDTLIWSTMIVGIPKITEKNAKEFHRRLRMHEHVCGALMTKVADGKSSPYPMTLEQVQAHIGLSTNADSCTPTQFGKKIVKWVESASR